MSRSIALAALLSGALVAPAFAGARVPPAPPHAAPSPHADAPPPSARPGECFARTLRPARLETVQEQVVVQEGRVERRAVPPRFAPKTRTVVVRDEGRRVIITEPVYEAVQEQVLVRPGHETTYVQPARLGAVDETVVVEPARLEWKLVRSTLQPAPVWCLVEVPARTAVVSRTVVLEPETARTVAVPPQYAVVQRQVLRRPGSVREEVIPAELRDVTVDELVEPGRVEAVSLPPRYGAVSRSRVVEPEAPEWTPVLCEHDATPHRIRAMQGALKQRGVYRGPVDGLYGPSTADAVRRFQDQQGLPHQGYLSLETLRRLDTPMASAGASTGPGHRPDQAADDRSILRY